MIVTPTKCWLNRFAAKSATNPTFYRTSNSTRNWIIAFNMMSIWYRVSSSYSTMWGCGVHIFQELTAILTLAALEWFFNEPIQSINCKWPICEFLPLTDLKKKILFLLKLFRAQIWFSFIGEDRWFNTLRYKDYEASWIEWCEEESYQKLESCQNRLFSNVK